jgi:fructan beta-fructosidase
LKGLRGQHGPGILSSALRGDAASGELTSREFRIEGRVLSLLVGGGTTARQVGVELWVDGEKQLSAGGDDSENLWPVFWNVARFQGKTAHLRVFDRSRRRHVLLDRVLLWR